MKISCVLVPVMLLITIGVKAQSIGPSTINASEGMATIGSSEFEWSVGEMTMVSTYTTPGIIVTQGVLQPADVAAGEHVANQLSKSLNVFPNPATDYVNVQYTSSAMGTLSCKLLDVTGKEISNQKVTIANGQCTEQVDLRSLAAATYMLEVTFRSESGSQAVSSYKVQKLH